MNLKNINIDIVKSLHRGVDKIYLGEYDEKTYGVSINGYVLYLIPKKDFIFNPGLFTSTDKIPEIFKRATEKSTNGYVTNELKSEDKRTVRAIKNDNTTVWVDDKYLKHFDCKTLAFTIDTPISPVVVYENNNIVGLIMPVNLNRKKQ